MVKRCSTGNKTLYLFWKEMVRKMTTQTIFTTDIDYRPVTEPPSWIVLGSIHGKLPFPHMLCTSSILSGSKSMQYSCSILSIFFLTADCFARNICLFLLVSMKGLKEFQKKSNKIKFIFRNERILISRNPWRKIYILCYKKAWNNLYIH